MTWDGPPVERRLHVIVNENIEAVMRDKRISVHDLADGTGLSARRCRSGSPGRRRGSSTSCPASRKHSASQVPTSTFQ
jgi:hypothetical protein